MNFQIDLLFDEERRSGSSVRSGFLGWLLLGVLGVVLLGLGATLFSGNYAARHERYRLEQDKADLEPSLNAVIALGRELNAMNGLLAAIESRKNSHLDAYQLLRGLQRSVPETIQLTQMIFSEKTEASGTAYVRHADISIKGQVAGEEPENYVKTLVGALKDEPPYSDIVEHVGVERFGASDSVDQPGIRVFDIACRLKPRVVEKPPSRPPGKVEK